MEVQNYGIKETTSIQTGRRGGQAEQAGHVSICGGRKFGRDILGARSPTPGPKAQESSARKISPHNFWLRKPEGLSQWKKPLESKLVPLKEPTHGPGRVAQLLRVFSRYTKVAGSTPNQGAYKNQPMALAGVA